MDRQRAELFQRIRERVQKAKNLAQQSSDQIHLLTSQIAQMEEKLSETKDFHFKNVLLSTLSVDVDEELYVSEAQPIQETMFENSDSEYD
jgi:hypothetical protein